MKALLLDRTPPPQPVSTDHYDAVVVGAGPYGLSAATHLHERGLSVAVFGKILELWRRRMPKGMLLRSHWWATNLSDPRKQYRFGPFLEASQYEKGYPMPITSFIDYGLWFQGRALPGVDETYVFSVEREGDHFLLTLEDGRTVRSAAVVMAIGLHYYAHRPSRFAHLPADLISHSCDHNDLSRFAGRRVVVIGGGQSAIEYGALLHEAGASAHVVARRPIRWLERDSANARTFLQQIRAPSNGLAPGWTNWALEHLPQLFYRLPQERKDRLNGNWKPAATEWLRERIIGKVGLHEGREVAHMDVVNGQVAVSISDGEKVRADHVILATGYKVDLAKLPMIHPALKAEIKVDQGIPVMNSWFESSVPGLYFTGLTSVRAFGPPFRFVVGCGTTARRVARSLAASRFARRTA